MATVGWTAAAIVPMIAVSMGNALQGLAFVLLAFKVPIAPRKAAAMAMVHVPAVLRMHVSATRAGLALSATSSWCALIRLAQAMVIALVVAASVPLDGVVLRALLQTLAALDCVGTTELVMSTPECVFATQIGVELFARAD